MHTCVCVCVCVLEPSLEYTDSTGIDLEEFLITTLKSSPRCVKDWKYPFILLLPFLQNLFIFGLQGPTDALKARAGHDWLYDRQQVPFHACLDGLQIDTLVMWYNVSLSLSLSLSLCSSYKKFPQMSSYHRMLVHRVAAYFGLEHNVDHSGKAVIINKTCNSRMYVSVIFVHLWRNGCGHNVMFFRPEHRFAEHVQEEKTEERRSILKRDTSQEKEDSQVWTNAHFTDHLGTIIGSSNSSDHCGWLTLVCFFFYLPLAVLSRVHPSAERASSIYIHTAPCNTGYCTTTTTTETDHSGCIVNHCEVTRYVKLTFC